VSEGRELARLVIHGALHLAGLDHQKAEERERMRRREEAALARCRVAIAALDKALAPKVEKRAKVAKLAKAKPARRAKAKPAPKPARRAKAKAAPKRKAASGRKAAPKRARARRGV
jgi:hypothetical protein